MHVIQFVAIISLVHVQALFNTNVIQVVQIMIHVIQRVTNVNVQAQIFAIQLVQPMTYVTILVQTMILQTVHLGYL